MAAQRGNALLARVFGIDARYLVDDLAERFGDPPVKGELRTNPDTKIVTAREKNG